MKPEFKYPRITHLLPVKGMYQERASYEGTNFLKVHFLAIIEIIKDEKIEQISRYLSLSDLSMVEYFLDDLGKGNNGYAESWIADIPIELLPDSNISD